jgi:MSHA biogenesis protein MshQ
MKLVLALSRQRLLWLAQLVLFVTLATLASWGHAASYNFPGSLPAGCSGSGTSYTCGSLTLAAGDTVAVTNANTTITFTSLTTNNAQINAAARANLTLTVSGTMTVGTGALVRANVNATYVNNAAGAATFVGNLSTTTSGAYLAASTTVTGNISATSGGLVTLLGSNTVTGNISTQTGYVLVYANSTINGNITTTTGNIDLRRTVSVTGNLSCSCSVYVYMYGDIGGTVSATHMNNDEGHSTFHQAITVTTGTLILGESSTVTGNLSSTSGSIYLQDDAHATGHITVTSTGVVELYAGASVTGNISSTSGFVLVYSDGVVTGNITTTSGNIDLRYRVLVTGTLSCACSVIVYRWADVTGNITGTHMNNDDGDSTFGGNITLTTGTLILGDNSTVAGSIVTTTGHIYLQGSNTVNGTIDCQCSLTVGASSTVGGAVTAQVLFNAAGTNSVFNASVRATNTNVHLGSGSRILGDAISDKGYVELATTSSVAQCVRARKTSGTNIYMYSGTSAGGVCCGVGSCGTSCVYRAGGVSLPAACSKTGALVAEYRFEQSTYNGTAGEVLDSSGNKRHGQMVGSASSTASGKICRGILIPKNLTSSIDAFNTGLDANTIGDSGTIAFWYKSVSSGSEHRMLYDATASASGKLYLYRDDSGSGVDLNAHITDGGGTVRDVDKLNAMSDATWTHIAVTWKFIAGSGATRLRLYVNAVQQDEQTYTVASGVMASAISTLYFGDNSSASSLELNSANGYMDQIKLYDAELTSTEISAVYAESPTCTSPAPHHIEVTTSSSGGPTCTPVTYTIKACADESCTSTYTDGISGALSLSGTPTVNYTSAFSIGAGNSTTTVSAHITTPGAVTAALSGLSVTPSNTPQVFCGMGAAAASGGSCVYTAADSALLFDVGNHVSEVAQAVTVSAVRSSNNATVCTPTFASVSKNVTFKCTYSNPTSGTKAVRVGGAALNAGNAASSACDGTGQVLSLSFDASGVASTTVQYADVGQMGLTARYDGSGTDAGLVMQGSDTFIAAPASFTISGVTAGNIAAGGSFAATVTAKNNAGNTTPNFGNETSPATTTLSFTKYLPTSAFNGSFSGSLGSFSSGAATANNLSWTEVGSGDLSVSLQGGSYLGTGISASGTTGSSGAVGPFVPHHFTVATTNACSSFTYSGQPFAATVTAMNAAGNRTYNYDGTASTNPDFAKTVTLSAATNGGTGSMSNASILPSSFSEGQAMVSTPVFTYTTKQTGPSTITVRATDTDGVTSENYAEGSLALRSGRLKLSNAFGTGDSALSLQLQTQYWSGRAWIISAGDNCTSVLANAVALSNYTNAHGAAGSWTTTPSAITISNGMGTLSLSVPSPAGSTGSVDVALNLGSTAADNACLGTHPTTTGGSLNWLRSRNGNCAATFDRDPAARATFGVYAPETRKTVYVRPIY